ncbi:PREDICTED: lebercilin-like protein [Crocodylus porosus]|uniref:lebercilin-like protein n=1 Tax=Crocodylus porosus TaxID=8502 RepID=UPI00093DA3A0|nr:PREDICTED: lebercilin-like protein [Crocodylus porosus]
MIVLGRASEQVVLAELMTIANAAENMEVSQHFHASYSEDFFSDCTESASSNSSLKMPRIKEKKLQKKKKTKCGRQGYQIKGSKKLPLKKMQHQNTSFLSNRNTTVSQKKDVLAQRIFSARLHKIKELKNELSDLQHKLEASDIENQLLKQLQYRHLKAIGKYENAENNLPNLIARHYNEVRSLRELLRKSQEQERKTLRKLRKVEAELLRTKDALQTLHTISEDKNLAERGELTRRLSVLTEKMEASDKKIQGLEKQLKLKNSIFNQQMAAESKKSIAARTITEALQMEMTCLHQKLKERERELGIRNIYTNQMFKSIQDKADPVPHKKGLILNKSVQVDKQSFKSLQQLDHQKQEREKIAVLLTEEKMTTENTSQNGRAHEAHKDAAHKKEETELTKKLLKPETSNRTFRVFLREETQLMEEKIHFECTERAKKKKVQERKADFLKELEKLLNDEQTPSTDDAPRRESNQEKDAVDENEKEERKKSTQLSDNTGANNKTVTPTQRNRTPTRLKKQYTFTEVIENLHQGIPASGPISNTGSFRNKPGRHQCETASKAKTSFGAYEPSFGKFIKARQKASPVEDGDYTHRTLIERKNTLMKELFGPGSVLKDNHSNLNTRQLEKEKSMGSQRIQNDQRCTISNNPGLQCGDFKTSPIKSIQTISSSEDAK